MPPQRSHFDSFIFMRNNSIQRRRFATEQLDGSVGDDARVSLLRRDAEFGGEEGSVAPAWVGRVEGLNYQITRVEKRVEELDSLHKHHLSRPNMEDNGEEEKRIQKLTQEITQMFSNCQKQLKQLQNFSSQMKGREEQLVRNIVINLVNRLTEITSKFRVSQGDYLRRVQAREERSQQYFSAFQGEDDDGLLTEASSSLASWSKQDVLLLEENNKFLRKREQEISTIVQSIEDLNTIFKDLAHMVSEQGEVVDRIDYNIENTSIRVEEGLKQLQQAERYQGNNRKMKCILVLAAILIFLLLLLIIVKS